MKINHPVTGREIPMSDDTVIVSKTNLKGTITYVNQDFINVAGFSESELLGKNHNIVRHPDVPAAAFQDLWDTIRRGEPWTGIVKNRAKSGDHYWVRANVTPVLRDGQIVEYISVRKPATRAEIDAAEPLYAQINAGKLPRPSLWQRLNIFARMKISRRLLISGLGLLLLLSTFLGMLVEQRWQNSVAKEAEIAGLEYIRPVRQLLQNLPKHRGMSNGLLNGDRSFEPKLRAMQDKIAQNIAAIREMEARHGVRLETTERLSAVLGDWEQLRGQLNALPAPEAFKRHTALIADVLGLIGHVGNSSGLVIDGRLDHHYLVDVLIDKIPPVSEYLGRTRGMGAGIAARGEFAPGQRDALQQLYASASVLFEDMDLGLQAVYRYNPELEGVLQGMVEDSLAKRETFFSAVREQLLGEAGIIAEPGAYFALGTAVIDANFAIFDRVNLHLREELEGAAVTAMLETYLLIGFALLTVVPVFLLAFVTTRSFKRGLDEVMRVFHRMSEGHYHDAVVLDRRDEIGDLFRSLKSTQIKLGFDVMDARQRGRVAQRLKQALDSVSANVMMADNDCRIIYLNGAVQRMFEHAQADIRQDLPNFDVSSLMGENIDVFHRNPSHQRNLLAGLTGTYQRAMEVGGRSMTVIASPVVGDDGERLGTVVEWQDRTEEVAIEEDLSGLVAAAREGDLSRRAQTEGRENFFLRMSEGINSVLDVVSDVFRDVNQSMSAMAGGDLTRNIDGQYEGIYRQVQGNVNETIANLERTLSEISDAADVISTGANEIVSGNNNLSARTEQQASSLEETAASMEELTGTVRNNADNAQQANQLASGARLTAEKGGEVVGQAVRAMAEISQASERIAEIIGVIDEIAFQTNLLALNASVEAARAGEQGRGFAVVATEVRNLAQRSATAAKEIKDLIQDSVGKVKTGSELVNASGETLEEIVVGVKRVGDIVSEIAAASAEQTQGIEQVNVAVTQMDETTQQNAALAEETSAASVSMNEKAGQMMRLVGFFKLSRERSHVPLAAAPAPRPAPTAAPVAANTPQPRTAAPLRAAPPPLAGDGDEDDWEEF